jgi:hypothetical protein
LPEQATLKDVDTGIAFFATRGAVLYHEERKRVVGQHSGHPME